MRRPVWKIVLIALSLSGMLSVGASLIGRLLVLDLVLKFLG